MSTFYDALKKATNSKQVQTQVNIKKNIPNIIAIILIIIVFLIVFNLVKARQEKKMVDEKKNNSAAARLSLSKTTNVSSAPVAVKKTYKGYELEGVICNEDTCIAVINGKLHRLEGAIDNFIVSKISERSADLLNPKDNSTMHLELK